MDKDYSEMVLGQKPRARQKNFFGNLEGSFKNPIIHREIHGEKVYVPLDLSRIWDRM
ncbi:hypothetical protein [Fredinandcohnia onubensis]|jgi:hypothetical protein|uniref:hypothetical protein n=1 Tax=Fredinandcohnia onubensis TaxID=1571209 RepID=UPI0015D51D7E|nr:hypothetical protein [Fredinandcohnia onubensis]